jgi:hypothetical protein
MGRTPEGFPPFFPVSELKSDHQGYYQPDTP